MSFRGSLNKHPSLTPPSGKGGGGWTVMGGRRGSFKSLVDGDFFFFKHRTERQERKRKRRSLYCKTDWGIFTGIKLI